MKPRRGGKYSAVFAIDPGTKLLGWSHFILNHNAKTAVLVTSGIIQQSRSDEWIKRIDQTVDQVMEALTHTNGLPTQVLIEQPENFGSGRGSAVTNSGAVNKLIACVFQIKGAVRVAHPKYKVQLLPVRQWKGNVPKHITQKRIARHWGVTEFDSTDESDAIGIGDYWIRKVLVYKPRGNIKGD